MDQVLNLLSVTYYPSENKAAQTEALNQLTAGIVASPIPSLTILLRIATEEVTDGAGAQIPSELRFVAVSRIKNFFKHDWSETVAGLVKNDPALPAFQNMLLNAAAKFAGDEHRTIRRQLNEAIRELIPETKWNYYSVIVPQIRSIVSITGPENAPQGVDVMAQALTLVELLVSLTRTFQFKFTAAICLELSKDILQTLPPLLTLCRVLGTPQLSPANLHMIHQVIKIFEDCLDVLLDASRLAASKPQSQKHANESGPVSKMEVDAAFGGLLNSWLEFMAAYPQEYLGAFMAATDNDVSKVVGNSRGYVSFVRTVKRIGLVVFGLAEDANRNAPLSVKAARKKATESKVTVKGNRKIYHAPKAAEEDNSSWITQNCWANTALPTRFAQMWLQWLQWTTQRANDSSIDGDILAAQRKASLQAIRFIKMGITSETMYAEIIIPHFMEIIGLLIGSLCYNEEDVAKFEDLTGDASELQDFCIMLEEDAYMMNEFTLRQAASNCIVAFAVASKSFHDGNLIFRILEALNAALVTGVDPNTGDELSGTPYLTYGYLHMLGHLKAQIRKRDELWKGAMEGALLTHVVPRMQSSPHLFLRVKALQVLAKYVRVPMSPENLGNFVAAVGALLQHNDARIRLAAIDTMCKFLEMKNARPYLKLVLLPLVNECMAMMERVRCSFIPSCLQYLCESYGVELIPVIGRLAGTISQQLCAALHEVVQEINAETVDESEKAIQQSEQNGISIIANCDALYHLVLACEHNIPLLGSIVPDILRPFTMIYTNPDLFDFVEKTCDALMHLLYLVKPISAELWAFFPHIYNLVMNHFQGVDSFCDFASCIDNYLSAEPANFLANAEAMRMTLEMCSKMILQINTSQHQKETLAAIQLVGSIYHQSRAVAFEPVCGYMPQIMQLALQGLQYKHNVKSDKIKASLVALVCDAFWFSPVHALQILEGAGATVFFLQTVGTSFPPLLKMLSLLRRKQMILGLTSLIEFLFAENGIATTVPSIAAMAAAEQAALIASLINIVAKNIVINSKTYTIRSRRLEKGLEEDVFEDLEEYADGDYDVDDEDDGDLDDSDVSDPEDDDSNEANEDDIDYSSPIDEICEVQFFLNFVNKMSGVAPHVLQLINVATMEEINASLAISQKFMSLCKQMEEREKAIHHKRAAELQ